MIILAAVLASGQALPWIDRSWLNEQVRREVAASSKPKRPHVVPRPTALKARPQIVKFLDTPGI